MSEQNRKFQLLPYNRLDSAFPWPIWLAGWVLILKAVFWIATEADVTDQVSTILGIKYILFLIPFLIAGFGIWNFKRWAFYLTCCTAGFSVCIGIYMVYGLSASHAVSCDY